MSSNYMIFGGSNMEHLEDTLGSPTPIMYQLDYYLISNSIASRTKGCDIIPRILTDHSGITLEINTTATVRGKGFWKLNVCLLEENNYI